MAVKIDCGCGDVASGMEKRFGAMIVVGVVSRRRAARLDRSRIQVMQGKEDDALG
jgi:hypothetical protein